VRFPAPALFALLLAFPLGCPGTETPDGGVPDAGEDPCANANDDGGGIVITSCNATDGTRCDISRNLTCTWNISTDEASCQCLAFPKALGEPCGGENGVCGAGTVCLGLSSAPDPICRKVCDLAEGTGCEQVIMDDPSNAYTCVPLRRQNDVLTETYGICFGVGTACDPFDDQCPTDQACGLIGRAAASRPLGAPMIVENCGADDPCVRGGICVPLVDQMGNPLGTKCYEPCALDSPMCSDGQCADVGLAFGLCITG
jgi:hypothetical protein